MVNCYGQKQISLMNRLRQLWTQHVYWTRFFIISTAADSADLKEVTDRLLRNPKDFARLLVKFYGRRKAEEFEKLFTEHLLIAAELVNAAKNNDTQKADDARKRWYENADEIACFLSDINPYWSQKDWQAMMYSHLEMTEREAVLRLQGKYAQDIRVFEDIENEALIMADTMSCGIIKQCFR